MIIVNYTPFQIFRYLEIHDVLGGYIRFILCFHNLAGEKFLKNFLNYFLLVLLQLK